MTLTGERFLTSLTPVADSFSLTKGVAVTLLVLALGLMFGRVHLDRRGESGVLAACCAEFIAVTTGEPVALALASSCAFVALIAAYHHHTGWARIGISLWIGWSGFLALLSIFAWLKIDPHSMWSAAIALTASALWAAHWAFSRRDGVIPIVALWFSWGVAGRELPPHLDVNSSQFWEITTTALTVSPTLWVIRFTTLILFGAALCGFGRRVQAVKTKADASSQGQL